MVPGEYGPGGMVPSPSFCGQTDTYENIAFPQCRVRPVKIGCETISRQHMKEERLNTRCAVSSENDLTGW